MPISIAIILNFSVYSCIALHHTQQTRKQCHVASCPFLSFSSAWWKSLNFIQLLLKVRSKFKEILYCYHSEYISCIICSTIYLICDIVSCIWVQSITHYFSNHYFFFVISTSIYIFFSFTEMRRLPRALLLRLSWMVMWMVMWMRIGHFQQSDLTSRMGM
jgi:hypothetical protein